MKKTNLSSKTILASGILLLALLGACKKDGLESKELLVYAKGEYGSTNNSVVAALTQTPVAVWGNMSFDIPVYATREVAADVDVYMEPNSSLVAQFNRDNGKKALLLPTLAYQINSNRHKIPAGSTVSDPMTVQIINAASLTDTNGYVLPLTITKVEGQDKGVRVSTTRATTYLYVPYNYTNVDTTQVPLAGATMSRTGWAVMVSNTTSGALGPAMLDGSNTTAWRSSNSTTAAKWVVLNMGSQQTIKGFKLVPNYVATAENPTQMTVSTSNDNINWMVQGIWKGTGPASSSSATSPDFKGVNFLVPVKAQYFRFDITALVSGGRVGIGELYAIQ